MVRRYISVVSIRSLTQPFCPTRGTEPRTITGNAVREETLRQ
jgi:hypothetical protein